MYSHHQEQVEVAEAEEAFSNDSNVYFRFRAYDYQDVRQSASRSADSDISGMSFQEMTSQQTFYRHRREAALLSSCQSEISSDGKYLAVLLADRIIISQQYDSAENTQASDVSVALPASLQQKLSGRIMRWLANNKMILVIDGLSQELFIFSITGEVVAEIAIQDLNNAPHWNVSSTNPVVDVIPLILSAVKFGFLLIHHDSLVQQVWLMDSEQELIVEVKPARQLMTKRHVENLVHLPKSQVVICACAADHDDQVFSDSSSKKLFIHAFKYDLDSQLGIMNPWEPFFHEVSLERGLHPINSTGSKDAWYKGFQKSISSLLSQNNNRHQVPTNIFYSVNFMNVSNSER